MPTTVTTVEASAIRPSVTRVARAGARDEGGGFTLIEVLVVMAIVALLLAVTIPTFSGSRHAGDAKVVEGVAVHYRDGIAEFQFEHANRVPEMARASDWSTGTQQEMWNGPIDMKGEPYLRQIPESVADGSVTFGGPGTSWGKRGRVIYEPTGPSTFVMRAETLVDGVVRVDCELGNAPGTEERC